eukprot:CAMPEP_0196761076 /NCGR_PEP_ID=MMETSP1095-20130614/182_1 /TAXON_ID=96789 ORGANISM="Chromulina nebulosa, Strain UTEXLB2642" /NCGR_SAMPLE_ID=MMETSP1095 /ASSEMBLY_ACC=CAM_ASM_000446 /LENGTH=963 /DNA_ID=CAMNT_0042110147 /DNA_START=335 /DNA_END=3226 /DNA_ORIENTATION=+
MPIQAAANKLKDELLTFGNPPVFPDSDKPVEDTEQSAESAIAAKSKGKKSKLVSKGQGGKTTRQWDILSKMVPEEEIALFADPIKWLTYFPPFGMSDLKAFGSAIDWRRSFITTSANPHYDSFIRWQFNKLKEGGKIRFGKRPNVFSVLDGQVCADHDRASGETVGPQEYTLIKLLILKPYPVNSGLNSEVFAEKNVYLAAATLRPETMYGQTNCFVLPEGNYGSFETSNGDVLIMSHRSAKGLAYQGHLKEWAQFPSIHDFLGTELIGLPLKAPNASYERVYTLPLLTISMSKGTGVVTSVPSDAPDDYVALKEFKEKPLWREKFGITDEMVIPFDVVPVVFIDGYGDKSAEVMCEKLDIKSTKDTEKLKQAKDEVYLKGFYEGVMVVGECVGMKVCDAKPIVRQNMISRNEAIPYFEPESTVISRSGDECIVALTDQWYLIYGDSDWKKAVYDHIHSENFNSYNGKILEQLDFALDWLKEWACSRQFGLGTLLPWDKQWVIESLSDSTIYMSFYTISHILTAENVSVDDLTDEVFDYIYLGKENSNLTISKDILDKLRLEFLYWYPMDLRVSAKDLIPNHLTMCLYNHLEIWKDNPELWPRGIYCNGQIMIDAEKMSKSKGNFLLLVDCVEEFSADATRFALADSGDSLEDANFDRSVANQAITYLFVEEDWIKSIIEEKNTGKLRTGEKTFMDKTLSNEINFLVESTKIEFEKLCFREGLHRCWFDMIIARDIYRDWSNRSDIPWHVDVAFEFINAFVLMISPICPHWSEHIWKLLGNSTSINRAAWPSYVAYDRGLRKQYLFFRDFLKNFRQSCLKTKVNDPKAAYVYVSSSYDSEKVIILQYLQSVVDSKGQFPADLPKQMKNFIESRTDLKKNTKLLMQFGAFMRDEALERGVDALAIEMTFDQKSILQENAVYIMLAVGLKEISIHNIEDGNLPGEKKKYEQTVPGKPTYFVYTLK